jgi:tetratricopeptide (TPR) repeat protein
MIARCFAHLVMLAGCMGAACNSPLEVDRSKTPKTSSKQVLELSKKAESLTEKGYDLKLEGRNGEALALFKEAHAFLVAAKGQSSEEVASNLDDQATIHLRTGNYKKARALYNRALVILNHVAPGESRLTSAVQRRLATLDALEKSGVTCNEPLSAGSSGRDNALPYFADNEPVYDGFGKLAKALKPCFSKDIPQAPVSVWIVLLGKGEILLSKTKGDLAGTSTAACIESTLKESSRANAPNMPKFSACYRNYTYPFIVPI